MADHSALTPLELPAADWSSWLGRRVDTLLDQARETLALLKDGTARDTMTVLELWNDADIALRDADSAPVRIRIAASAGILVSTGPVSAAKASQLLDCVDRALYVAKRSGGGRWTWFDEDIVVERAAG